MKSIFVILGRIIRTLQPMLDWGDTEKIKTLEGHCKKKNGN